MRPTPQRVVKASEALPCPLEGTMVFARDIAALDVRPVDSRADRRAFVEFPYELHRNEARWVPPLRSEQWKLLDERRHPFYDFAQTRLFLARAQGRVVGRIAAVSNPRAVQASGVRRGYFGTFDCIDSPAVAERLFAAAGAWLGERGLSSVLGPVNFSTNYECGMLVEGFDEPPAVQMPYNPSYYPELVTASGFRRATDLLAWELPTRVHENERILRLARHAARRSGITVRPLRLRDFTSETARIRELYNSAWQDNWGFSPMTEREFSAMAAQLRPLLEPELCQIAEHHGRPVGFTLALPDLAPALAAANGRLHTYGFPVGLLRLLRARRHLHRIRVIAMGMLEEHRNRGVDLLLHTRLSQAAQRLGFHTAEASWVLADNERANRRMGLGGARISKRYRLYERPV